MAIPAMALLLLHNGWWDILIEPAVRRHAAIKAQGHSELGASGTGGVWNWGCNSAVKTNRLVCRSACLCHVKLSVFLSAAVTDPQ